MVVFTLQRKGEAKGIGPAGRGVVEGKMKRRGLEGTQLNYAKRKSFKINHQKVGQPAKLKGVFFLKNKIIF